MLHSKSFVLSSVFLTVLVCKHWFVDSGWEMAEALAHVVSETTKSTLREATFIAVSADEVTTIDHESWLSVHAYV